MSLTWSDGYVAVFDGSAVRVVRCGTCEAIWFAEFADNPDPVECPGCHALVDIPPAKEQT